MKTVTDLNGVKTGQALLPTLLNALPQKSAGQTKRGFADNLRDQISASDSAAGNHRTSSHNAVDVTPVAGRPAVKSRGTELPVREHKLPPAQENAAISTDAATGKRVIQKESEQSALGEHGKSPAPHADTTSEHEVFVTETLTTTDTAAPEATDLTSTEEFASPVPELPRELQVISETQAVPYTLESVAIHSAGNETETVGPLLKTAAEAAVNVPATAAHVDFWSGLTVSPESDPDQTGRGLSHHQGVVITGPVLTFVSAPGATNNIHAVAEQTNLITLNPADSAQLQSLQLTDTAIPVSRPETATEMPLIPGASAGQQGQGSVVAPTAPPAYASSVFTPAQAQATAFSVPASSSASMQDPAELASETAEPEDPGFAGRLLDTKSARITALQAAGAQQAVNVMNSAMAPDAPLDAAFLQSLTAGLASDAAGTEALLPSAGSSSSAPSSGQSTSASGLSAALYSLEQRQQAAAEARSLQSQTSRGMDTGLSTTSVLKLPGLDVAFGQAGWADRIGRQLLLQSAQGTSTAQIRLDPPELGSLTVKIQLIDQSAAVSFVSPHAMVRDELQQQAGRLQDMFREQGMDLSDVSVSDESSHSDTDSRGHSGRSADGTEIVLPDDTLVAPRKVVHSESLIDYYA